MPTTKSARQSTMRATKVRGRCRVGFDNGDLLPRARLVLWNRGEAVIRDYSTVQMPTTHQSNQRLTTMPTSFDKRQDRITG
jgi:hypothetical protein